MSEEWRDIPGWEGFYQVSDQGRVKSLGRVTIRSNGYPIPVPERIMRAFPSGRGAQGAGKVYRAVGLARAGRRGEFTVHRLVLLAFVGAPADGMECCHNDGDPTNNVLSNLRWDTRSSNQLDRVRHGTNHDANKTSCDRGHPYTEQSMVWRGPQYGRVCRECSRIRTANYRARKAAA